MIEHTKCDGATPADIIHDIDRRNMLPFLSCDVMLIGRFREVPHPCSDPTCKGDINRRKLEAWDVIAKAWNEISANSAYGDSGGKDMLLDMLLKAVHEAEEVAGGN